MADRKTEKLSAKMKSQAVGLGLCQQWTDEWADGTSKDELVEKFVRGIDFCIEHNFPSCEVIRKEFEMSFTTTACTWTRTCLRMTSRR